MFGLFQNVSANYKQLAYDFNFKDIEVLKDSIKNNKSNYPFRFKDFKHFTSKDHANRANCVILPLDALKKAFKL